MLVCIGWIPNYGGTVTSQISMRDAIGRAYVQGDIREVIPSLDDDMVNISIGESKIASLIPLDEYGLCRLEVEDGLVPKPGVIKLLWRRICSIFTGDSQIPESFLIRVREDEQMTEGLHDLLLTGFFDDLMETIKDSNVIFKGGLGYKRVKSCSSFYANLKRMKSFFESFVRIYGDMLNKTVVESRLDAIRSLVDGFEAENDRMSSKYHVTVDELMKDVAIIGLVVTSIGMMIGWMRRDILLNIPMWGMPW